MFDFKPKSKKPKKKEKKAKKKSAYAEDDSVAGPSPFKEGEFNFEVSST